MQILTEGEEKLIEPLFFKSWLLLVSSNKFTRTLLVVADQSSTSIRSNLEPLFFKKLLQSSQNPGLSLVNPLFDVMPDHLNKF